jgi:uncharacterized protein (TIGR03085 family)
MGPPPLDKREREELCDLFVQLGPDAPTMCEGWTTADLAAHLVVRERDPRSSFGILRPQGRWGDYTRKLMTKRKAKGYDANVARVRKGAPLFPWRTPGLRTMLNLNEYVVHHEDVRRANGLTPRTDRPELDAALWKLLQRGAKFTTRSMKGMSIVLVRSDGEQITARNGTPEVQLHGAPVDLVLFLMGRPAEVTLAGEPDAVARVTNAKRGV